MTASEAKTAGLDARPVPAVFQELWRRLDAVGVPYCVLAPTGAPELLVERHRADDLEQAMAATDCKRLQVGNHWAGASADYLANDEAGSGLRPLRVHYRLPLGPRWEAALLGSRCRDEACGCFRPDPDLAVLLAAVRRAAWPGALAEVALDRPVDPARLRTWTQDLLGQEAAAALPDLAAAVQRGLDRLVLQDGPLRRLRAGWLALTGRLRHPPRPAPARGGVFVALIGCDGSGKSTVTAELVRWLRPALRVQPVYLGSGQGPSSFLRWPLLVAHRAFPRRAAGPAAGAAGPARRGRVRAALRPLWSLLLAREKQRKLAAAWQACREGAVVICDRYPQNEIMGFNDGPLLSEWSHHRSPWRRLVARWERRPYAWAEQHPPDLVVKLRISKAVALARKPDMSPDEIARRVAAVETLRFGEPTRTLVVDAEAPIEQVLRRVKSAIWSEM